MKAINIKMKVVVISLLFISIFCIGHALPNTRLLGDGRIVGGKVVAIEDFPYQVSLLVNNFATCGGSIISSEYVLTAAHCGVIKDLLVRAGTNFTYKGGSLHKVAKSIVHENYTSRIVPRNDIALLKITPPFDFDDTRRPVGLVSAGKENAPGDLGIVSGFGRIREGGSTSINLRAVKVPIVDRKNCSNTYTSMGFPGVEIDFICAGFLEGGKDSCQGDSGGPYVINGKLAGIVSYGLGCSRPRIPGVYSNVAHFRDWITKNSNV